MRLLRKTNTQLLKKVRSLQKQVDECVKLESRLKRQEKKLKSCIGRLEERVECGSEAERIINKQLRSEIELRKQLEEEVRASEKSLAEAQNIAHLGSWEYIVETHETRWSEEEFRIFGLTPVAQSPTFEEHLLLIHPDDVNLITQSVAQTLSDSRGFTVENRIKRPDGTLRYVQNIAKPVLGKDGKPVKIVGTTLDITELQERSAALNTTRQQLENIVNGIEEQIILISKDFKILWANKTFLEQYGCKEGELLGKYCYGVTHDRQSPCQPPNDMCPIMEVLKTEKPKKEVHVHSSPKGELFFEVSAYPIKDEKGEIIEFVHIARDISAQKKVEEELRALSLTDPLTGLFNRRGFMVLSQQQMKIAKRNKQDMGLIFTDLDNMKWINDTFGHAQGDAALQEVGQILLASFRESDIVARIGGDEFVVLAIAAGKQSTDALIAGFKSKLDARSKKLGQSFPLSLSVGIAYCESGFPCVIDDLLSRADALMYEQKRSRKNKF